MRKEGRKTNRIQQDGNPEKKKNIKLLKKRGIKSAAAFTNRLTFRFKRCLPDCEETQYTYSVSAAPFRGCDFKNLGLTPLCDVGGFGSGGGGGDDDDHTGLAGMRPPMWGTRVIRQYG